ncbi:MAG TPA: DUF1674 domain-containing protein [Devosia sp.]|nr:DUF1674 domain-containing protein [Devosia sp.]
MKNTTPKPDTTPQPEAARKQPDNVAISPAARRALAEAEKRRQEIDARTRNAPPEKGGRGGLDPARFNDWEVKGMTSDF